MTMPSESKVMARSGDERPKARGRLPRWSQRATIARVLAVVTLLLGTVVQTTQGASASVARWSASPAQRHPVALGTRGVGQVPFGIVRMEAVKRLQGLLGPPNWQGINTGCGPRYTEVAWRDFIAEFYRGHFSGYRYMLDVYAVEAKGSPRDHAPGAKGVPFMSTSAGITLGSDLAELRPLYKRLRQSGADSWTAPSGLTFVVWSGYRNMLAGSDRMVEIKIGTCGAF